MLRGTCVVARPAARLAHAAAIRGSRAAPLRGARRHGAPAARDPAQGLVAFCDGACLHNGKPNAAAAYSSVWPHYPEFNGGWPVTEGAHTNNIGEFMGLVRTLEIADAIDPARSQHLTVHTDSQFMINCLTKWIHKWKVNGFMKVDGTPVANQELLLRLDGMMRLRSVTLKHVRAHTNRRDWVSVHNAKADRLARQALPSRRK